MAKKQQAAPPAETTYLIPNAGMVFEGQVLSPEEIGNNPEAIKKAKEQSLPVILPTEK